MGGSSTSDNVGPMNLLNLRRVAYGVRELADLREDGSSHERIQLSQEYVENLVKSILEKLAV
jgi:hypothetical protein